MHRELASYTHRACLHRTCILLALYVHRAWKVVSQFIWQDTLRILRDPPRHSESSAIRGRGFHYRLSTFCCCVVQRFLAVIQLLLQPCVYCSLVSLLSNVFQESAEVTSWCISRLWVLWVLQLDQITSVLCFLPQSVPRFFSVFERQLHFSSNLSISILSSSFYGIWTRCITAWNWISPANHLLWKKYCEGKCGDALITQLFLQQTVFCILLRSVSEFPGQLFVLE